MGVSAGRRSLKCGRLLKTLPAVDLSISELFSEHFTPELREIRGMYR